MRSRAINNAVAAATGDPPGVRSSSTLAWNFAGRLRKACPVLTVKAAGATEASETCSGVG
jgi:hypothetical protein